MNARPVLLLIGGTLAACGQRTIIDGSARADSLLAIATQLHQQADFDSVRRVLEPLRATLGRDGDRLREARALTQLGLSAWRSGDNDAARRFGENALAIKESLGLRDELFVSFNGLGLLAWDEGRLFDAWALFERADTVARASRNDSALGRVLANRALVFSEWGRFAEARRDFSAAQEIARRLGERRLEGNSLANLAMLAVRMGDPGAAVVAATEARAIHRAIGYAIGEENAIGQLGTAYLAMGDPQRALALMDTALAAARAQGLRQGEASNLEVIADIYREAGNMRRALDLYAQASAINAELGLEVERGANLRRVAEVHRVLGTPDLALASARRALDIHRRLGATHEELDDLLLLSEVAQNLDRPSAAAAYLGEAAVVARRLATPRARARVALSSARVADGARRSAQVVALLDQPALGALPEAEWEAAMLRARALLRLGRVAESVQFGQASVAAVERMRLSYYDGWMRALHLSARTEAYDVLIRGLLRLGRIEEAFMVADAARGRALIEHAGPGAIGRAEAALRALAQVEARLAEIDDEAASDTVAFSAERAELGHRAARLRSEHAAAREAAMRADDRAAILGTGAADARATRGALSATEALVSYFVGQDTLLAFVLTARSLVVVGWRARIADVMARMRVVEGVVSERGSSAGAALQALHMELLEPVLRRPEFVGTTTLFIVPHGSLGRVPFAALQDRSGRHLVERVAVAVLPSAAALQFRQSVPRGDAHAAALFAPDGRTLPASSAEIRRVSEILGGGVLYLDARATEAQVRRSLGSASLVHLAGHGELNRMNPSTSHFRLAAGGGGAADDGRLEVAEVLRVKVRSSLVFLSGCETAAGSGWITAFDRGDDYATLGQAFLYAGAAAIVATLWRVEDEAASRMATRFYGHLAAVGPIEALARAQRESQRAGDIGLDWAAYGLIGAPPANPAGVSVNTLMHLHPGPDQ